MHTYSRCVRTLQAVLSRCHLDERPGLAASRRCSSCGSIASAPPLWATWHATRRAPRLDAASAAGAACAVSVGAQRIAQAGRAPARAQRVPQALEPAVTLADRV